MVNILVSACESSDWNTYWTREVAKINFFSSATTHIYRSYTYSGNKMKYVLDFVTLGHSQKIKKDGRMF